MADTHRGTCFCGAVEFEVSGPPLEAGYCHCESCRRYSGAPVSAYLLWPADAVRITAGAELIGRYNKVGTSDRRHCRRCGGHLMTHHPQLGLTDVRPPSVAGIAFAPTVHLHYAEAVLPIRDGLPKLRDFPAAVGGSGAVLEAG